MRRLAVLARNLPRDSATVRSVLGPAGEWNTTEHLLASVVDFLAVANWQRAGGKRTTRPTPLPRPGERNGENETTHGDSPELGGQVIERMPRTVAGHPPEVTCGRERRAHVLAGRERHTKGSAARGSTSSEAWA